MIKPAKPPAKPLVAVPSCMKDVGGQPFHAVGDKYVRALAEVADVQPIILPNLDEFVDARSLLPLLDGLMLTGSPSNVHPSHYGADHSAEHEPHDPARDAVTLPLIRAAIEEGVPLLAICRGFQELNVVLGGTLHPAVHTLPGRLDHRSPQTGTMAGDYAPRHPLLLTPGGRLAQIFGAPVVQVNSLHRQAIDRLADGLVAEGTAPDGTIEAISVKGARAFAIGVQWHPEYRAIDNPDSVKLFRAFGSAVKERMHARLRAAA